MLARALVGGLGILLSSCATTESEGWQSEPPRFVAESRTAPVALVLSGGSARGFAHAGVLKVLEANGLRPDLIVGCSAGSIIGSLYASGLDAAQVERAVASLDTSAFGEVAVPGLAFLSSPLGLLRGDRLHGFIDRNVARHRIEDFPIRFAAAATNLESGQPAIFNAGDVGLAVQASSAIPGLLAPARIGGQLYSDCQVSNPLPVLAARLLGARRVIAVDVVYPPGDAGLTSSVRVMFQAFTIATFRLKEWEATGADLVIAPDLPRTSGQFGLADRPMLIEAGARATERLLPQIRALFAR